MLTQYTCSVCDRVFETHIIYDPANTAICRFCKGKITNLKRYGVSNIFKKKEYIKNCVIAKYGVDNVRKAPEIIQKIREKRVNKTKEEKEKIVKKREDSFKKLCGENYKDVFVKHYKKTCLEKYGVENVMQNTQIKTKCENTFLEKYGVKRPSTLPEIKSKISKSHLNIPLKEKQKIQNKRARKYTYDNQNFDSKPELAFYIYCKDHNKDVKREPKCFEYFWNNQKHYYFPDFESNGRLYEIKGSLILAENGSWRSPFDKYSTILEAKHQCALKNNVIILYTKDYQKYLDYVNEKYGKDYLQQFRNKKEVK